GGNATGYRLQVADTSRGVTDRRHGSAAAIHGLAGPGLLGAPRVSAEQALATATPGGVALGAIAWRPQRLHGVCVEPGGLVAGEGFELLVHPQAVALVGTEAVLDRDVDVAALLATGGRPGDDLHRAGAWSHMHPGAAGKQQGRGDHGRQRKQAHGQLRQRKRKRTGLWPRARESCKTPED